MATGFSEAWVRLRQQAGFKTPHEFYSRSGGRKVLEFSFVTYWKIEKGQILPKPERLPILFSRLRLAPDGQEAAGLARAYLKEMMESEQAYEWLTRAMGSAAASAAASGESIGERAIKRAVIGEIHRMSLEEVEAIFSSFASYWAFAVLSNRSVGVKVEELAKKLGVTKAELEKGLKALAARKLAKKEEDGLWRSALAGKAVRYPPQDAMRAEARDRLREYHERMVKSKGQLISHAYNMPRAADLDMAAYFPHLSQAVSGVHVYNNAAESGGAAQFLIEGNIYRLFSL